MRVDPNFMWQFPLKLPLLYSYQNKINIIKYVWFSNKFSAESSHVTFGSTLEHNKRTTYIELYIQNIIYSDIHVHPFTATKSFKYVTNL